ncbi:SH3 domain-containing protein [Aliirhizobium smilacinae]|nr:SH3 domain-containing protein [Rhizobium smilacinae]
MNKFLMSAAAFCTLLVAPSIADAAVRGTATANVNMRSGPSTGYPAVTVIPYGAPVTIYGCMSSVNWCDVNFDGGRGWVSGNYVQASYRSNRVYVAPDYYGGLGIPSVTFDVDRYWGSYYRDRNFYRERDRWRDYNWRAERPLPPPPRWDDGRRPPPPGGWDRNRDRDRWDQSRDRDRDRWDRDRDRDREARDRDRDRDRPRFDNNDRRPSPPPGWDRDDRRDRDRDRDRDRSRERDRDRDRPQREEQRPPRAERPQREEQRPPRAERPQREEQQQRQQRNQNCVIGPNCN